MGDLTGDDVGTIFADAVGGVHLAKPLGVADVLWNGCAWSVKTVKQPMPFKSKRVRLISGCCSPDYSLGIQNPHKKPQVTGRAVLAVWNARVNEALTEHDDLRRFVLVRNMEAREFLVFEEENRRYIPDNFTWSFNSRSNLEGFEIATGEHRFTWQRHGSQFTIIRPIPGSARRFSLSKTIPTISVETVLENIEYNLKWIDIHD